ncbi:hypothetical protein ACFQO7_20165 [Catellatospora aurea]|uniref:Lipoprotein n=1 Tax=Catellatospora aurea TaxID=1337874 RepID=A0ABW2H3A4_9ACTN
MLKFGTMLAAVALATAACGTTSTSEPPQAQPTGSAPVVDGDAFREVGRLRQELDDAIGKLEDRCMLGKGFTVLLPREPRMDPGFVMLDIYSSPSSADAERDGYGIAGRVEQRGHDVEPQPTGAWYEQSLEEQRRYERELTGSGDAAATPGANGTGQDGGCRGAVLTAAYGTTQRGPRNPTYQHLPTEEMLAAVPEVRKAREAWALCVAKAGYPRFEQPGDAAAYAQYFFDPVGSRPGVPVPKGGPWPLAEARMKERTLAVADARCADEHQVRETVSAQWALLVDQARRRIEPQLVAYAAQLRECLVRVQQELGGK